MSLKRPTQRARWAWGGSATLVQPPSGSAEAGFATEQRPSAQWFNWQFNTYGAWLDFLAGPDVEKWERNIWPGTPASDHFDAPSSIAFDVDTVTSDSSQTAAAFRYACVGDTIAAGAKMFVSQRGNDWEARASGMPSGVIGPYAIKALAAGRWLLGCLSSLGAALVYYGATDNGTAAGPMGAEGNTWSLAGMPVGATEVKAFAQLTSSSNVVAACATEAMYSSDGGATWSAATFSSSPSHNGLDVVSDGVKYVWVSQDGEVYNSPDGATWTDVATLAPGAGAWRLCAGAAGEVCAYRIGNSASVDIYRSTDSGVSWTAVAQTGDAPKRITKIAYRDGAWIVTGARSPWLWTSNDLAAWRTLYVPTMSASATAIPPALYNVAWDGGRWCAIGNGLVLTCGRAADPADGTYVASDTPSTLSDAGSLRGRLLSTDTPTDGQVLTWVAADARWKPSTPSGSSSPTTTRGDLIVRGASADGRLAIGASGRALLSDGTDPVWTALTASHVSGVVPTTRTIAGLDLSTDRSAAALVAALQSAARTLPESLPVGATWTASNGLGTATASTLTLTLPGSTVTSTDAARPYLSAPHGRNAWQMEVTARLAAFTGGSTTTWTALLIANASAAKWILAQARGDGELSILSQAGSVATAVHAFALAGNDRLRILVRDGLVTVYVGDGTHWVRHYHSDIGGLLPRSTSGDYARVGLRLSESSGAAGTITAQWADVIVRGL